MLTAIVFLVIVCCCAFSSAQDEDPCNASNQGQKLPYPGDCRKFIFCNQYIPNVKTSIVIDCCDNANNQLMYFDPETQTCTFDATVCKKCNDPCNEENQYSKQPCDNDCTKFWMCNENIKGHNSSLLLSCCEGKDEVYHFDPVNKECVQDPTVCLN